MARCLQCQLYFLTSTCNRGRHDLCCPFGCREERKRQKSHKRSKTYYQCPEGKKKKELINQNRKRSSINTSRKSPVNDAIINYIILILSSIHGSPQDRAAIKSLYYSFDDPIDEKMRQQGLGIDSS